MVDTALAIPETPVNEGLTLSQDHLDLDQACCGRHEAGMCSQPLCLGEVLEQFRDEAYRGTCNTGRYRCSYYEWGSGPPLIFIHGLGDDAESFVMPIARLSKHFRCIAYNLPEGRDDGARLSNYRHRDLVADLLALLDHWEIARANVFGSSFGSTIAMVAMHQRPGRFSRAILQGGFARRPLAPAEELLACWGRYWPWEMNQLPFRIDALRYSHFGPFSTREPEVWQFFLDRDGAHPMQAIARRALILNKVNLRPILSTILHPVLLICGDCDPLVGKSCEKELLDGLPHPVRAELEGCGHMPHFTHPEILAEVVRRFLQGEWT